MTQDNSPLTTARATSLYWAEVRRDRLVQAQERAAIWASDNDSTPPPVSNPNAVFDSVAAQKHESAKYLAEDVAAIAATVAATYAWEQHATAKGADTKRGGKLWGRGLGVALVIAFLLNWAFPGTNSNGDVVGATPGMWLLYAIGILGLPALFLMIRFTPPKKS